MFRRLGSAVLFSGLLFVSVPALAAFPDVPSTHPNYEAINYVQEEGIVAGYPDGTFGPDKTINRAEFAKIIIGAYRSLGNGYNPDDAKWISSQCIVYLEPEGFFTLSDVQEDSWYGIDVCFAATIGLIDGYSDGTFRASNQINFAEAAKIIAGGFGMGGDPDFSSDPWYRQYAEKLATKNAIPLSITRFDQFITRGEMAEMVYRLKTMNTDKPSRTYEEMVQMQEASDRYVHTLSYGFDRGIQTPPERRYDAQLIQKDVQTGKERVLIESIKSALPALTDSANHTIKKMAEPANGTVVFAETYRDTEGGTGSMYVFDPNALLFTKMKINEKFVCGFCAVSPDGNWIIWSDYSDYSSADWQHDGDAKTLYVADLQNDEAGVLVKLSGNETLNKGGYALSANFDIQWLDAHTVQYSVYDWADSVKALIDRRIIKIP